MSLLAIGSAWNMASGLGQRLARPQTAALCKSPVLDHHDRVDLQFRKPHSAPKPAPAPAPAPSGKYYDAAGDGLARQKYYGDSSRFDSMSPTELYNELSGLVQKTHKSLDYDPEQYLYPTVDRREDGQLYCIYSGEGPKESSAPAGQHPLAEGQFNCEHVVPQSWFGKKKTPKGDLHHLYAAQTECNSLRGNAEYDAQVGEGEQMLLCGILDQHKNLFNPKAGHGEIARSVLYFLLCYPGMIGDRRGEYSAEDIPMLLKWSNENPPTEYERHRNQYIEKLQGNRNPLVDFPELVNKVDFTKGLGQIRAGR
ncbi:endonuclease [bacterium]|nr:endonuclease [bacterium]